MRWYLALALVLIASWGCAPLSPTATQPPPVELTPTSGPARAGAGPAPDFGGGTWRAGIPMSGPGRSEMPAVTLGDAVYVPGGFGGPTRLARYDPRADAWQALAELPAGRHHLMAAAFQGRLYLFGGAEGDLWAPTEDVWVYDPAADEWQTLEPMPEARMAGAAVTLGDRIYVVGGSGDGEALLAFDPARGTWQTLPGPRQPREHVAAVAFDGELWALGGRWSGAGELKTVEIYDPAAGTWRDGPSLSTARAGFAAVVIGEHIVVAGGEVIFTGRETLGSVEYLSPGAAAWRPAPDLPVPVHGVGGAAFEGQFLVLGGSLRAGAIENQGDVQIYRPQERVLTVTTAQQRVATSKRAVAPSWVASSQRATKPKSRSRSSGLGSGISRWPVIRYSQSTKRRKGPGPFRWPMATTTRQPPGCKTRAIEVNV